MAPLRFAANLQWLFAEAPGAGGGSGAGAGAGAGLGLAAVAARAEAAGRAGFRAAELPWPFACAAPDLRRALERAGLRLVLLNTPPGEAARGEMGLGAVPGRQHDFRQGLALAVRYARELACPRIHIMAGRVPEGTDRASLAVEMEATFIDNLRHAANVLAQEDMVGLLEPINTRITDPRYFLSTPQQAAAILEQVGQPNLKLQLDIFHLQIMDGNLTRNLETYFPLIGHIQIAQVPARQEPDTHGEVNFPYLFQQLELLGYTGYVGCEYAPRGDTAEGLGWLREYWQSQGLEPRGSIL